MEQFVKNNRLFTRFFSGCIFILLLIVTNEVNGQSQNNKPVLERIITIRFSNEKTGMVLNNISQLGAFNFSYNPAIIDADKIISGNFQNKPIREILNAIFSGKLEFRERKSYVILQKAKQPTQPADKVEYFVFSGYVRDEAGAPLPWASLYDKASLESTVSNDYGFYRIRFSEKQLPLTLFFTKQGFRDTSISVVKETPAYNNVTMRMIVQPIPQVNYDSLSAAAENTASTFFSSWNNSPNDINIKDTLYRKYQVSFLPYAGTNLRLSGNVVNEYSFNVFGGISMGTTKAELGGFFNLNKGDVSGLQLAGFTNLDGGNFKGLQMSGFVNLVRKNVSGAQLAGFANVNFGNMKGVQLAGFVNGTMQSVNGLQMAGFCNIAGNSMKGTQASGFLNVVPDTLTGTQIGFINYSNHLEGSQIGFLNVSKSTSGIPIGFLSYVHTGYHKLEISADEILPLNISFRTGVNSFHNILTAGINPLSNDSLLWNFGYGFGSSIRLGRKSFLDFDLTSSQIVEGNNIDAINLLNKAYVGVDTRLAKKLSLAFGITLNGQLTKATYQNYPDPFSWYQPNIFYDQTWLSDNTRLQMWLGAKIALRYF